MAYKAIYRAKITRIMPQGVYVEIPHLGSGLEFGPSEVSVSSPLSVGDRVVVGQIEDIEEDFVVLAKVGSEALPPAPHIHDDRYYTETESDARFAAIGHNHNATYALIGHNHDDRYFTETESDARFAAIGHNHNATYAPIVHGHALTDANITGVLPIAKVPTGTSGVTVALGNHLHDDRYYTETESDARYPSRAILASIGGSVTWFRVASINGQSGTSGANISILVSGQGNYGQAQRNTELVHFGQRGDNVFTFEAWHFGLNTSAWTWHVKQISTYVFELWAKRPTFDGPVHITTTGSMNGTLTVDSATTVDPVLASAGTAVNVDQVSRNAVIRIVHGSNAATARHTWATYVEWVGSVNPINATANDTWVNTTP